MSLLHNTCILASTKILPNKFKLSLLSLYSLNDVLLSVPN